MTRVAHADERKGDLDLGIEPMCRNYIIMPKSKEKMSFRSAIVRYLEVKRPAWRLGGPVRNKRK